MTISTTEIMSLIAGFAWPFVRFGALFLIAPVFSAPSVPVRIRILLAIFIAYLVAPTLDLNGAELGGAQSALLLAQEVTIGFLMGLMAQVVFAAVSMAGQTVATSMGLGFAAAVDPQNGVQVTVVGQFYLILTTLIFLLTDSHLMLIRLVVDSYTMMPLSPGGLPLDTLLYVVLWGGELFVIALLIALPVVIGVIIANVAMGVITRSAPQLNIFAVGFPFIILAGFILLMFSVSGFPDLLIRIFQQLFLQMQNVMSI